jgi:WD40 repeat protein
LLRSLTIPDERASEDRHPEEVCFAFSPDGALLAAGTENETGRVLRPLRLWDLRTGKEVLPFGDDRGRIGEVAFSPDGRTIATADAELGTISLWDSLTGKRTRRMETDQWRIFGLVFTPNGKKLVSAGENGTILVWNVSR